MKVEKKMALREIIRKEDNFRIKSNSANFTDYGIWINDNLENGALDTKVFIPWHNISQVSEFINCDNDKNTETEWSSTQFYNGGEPVLYNRIKCVAKNGINNIPDINSCNSCKYKKEEYAIDDRILTQCYNEKSLLFMTDISDTDKNQSHSSFGCNKWEQ